MAASWEIQQQNQVLTVILTRETVTSAWAAGFRNLTIPGTYTFLSGMPFGHARNTGCKKLLELDFEWLFFLDDDVIPPHDAIIQLVNYKQPIVSGVYYRRNPPICPVMLLDHNDGNGLQWVANFTAPGLLDVDLVGAGCLLINKSVLQKIPEPWFEWRVDRDDLPRPDRVSEDFYFCRKAKEYGYQVKVATEVQCRHIGLGEARTGGIFVPGEIIA